MASILPVDCIGELPNLRGEGVSPPSLALLRNNSRNTYVGKCPGSLPGQIPNQSFYEANDLQLPVNFDHSQIPYWRIDHQHPSCNSENMTTSAEFSSSRRVPPGAWDSHVHVVDEDTFPFHPQHSYRPGKATVHDLQLFHRKLGVSHSCLVAVSVYGTNCSSILDALAHMGGQGRAVACIDPETISDLELQSLHHAGVRGSRLNLRTRGEALDVAALHAVASRIRPLGWALQLYLGLEQIPELVPIIPELNLPLIIDHLGSPQPSQGPIRSQKGYSEFLSLLRSGLVWTKLSGVYRFADLPDLDSYVEEILRSAPGRVVWASDWPHTGGVSANPGGDRTKLQEYRQVDDAAWVERCWKWCQKVEGGDGTHLASMIWVDNPRKLWQCKTRSASLERSSLL